MGIAVLLRHGRSTANVEGILAGRMPGVALHASGREQTRIVAAAFPDDLDLDLHVSPLDRTRETADLVFGARHRRTAEALLECDYGDWTGRALSDLALEPLWAELHREPSSVRFPHGESIPEVADRAIAYVTHHASGAGVHVFVTHADPILMIASHAAGAPLDAYQRLHVEPCSLTAVSVSPRGMHVLAVNVPPEGAAALVQSLVASTPDTVREGGSDDAHRPSL